MCHRGKLELSQLRPFDFLTSDSICVCRVVVWRSDFTRRQATDGSESLRSYGTHSKLKGELQNCQMRLESVEIAAKIRIQGAIPKVQQGLH